MTAAFGWKVTAFGWKVTGLNTRYKPAPAGQLKTFTHLKGRPTGIPCHGIESIIRNGFTLCSGFTHFILFYFSGFPADLLCIWSSNAEHQCFVETMNLDCETMLKHFVYFQRFPGGPVVHLELKRRAPVFRGDDEPGWRN
jgi:hypothetical protein